MPFAELADAWSEVTARVDAGLAGLDPAALAAPAPPGPGTGPGDTLGTLIGTTLFHQAYHAGQLGVLRRVAGKRGAIA